MSDGHNRESGEFRFGASAEVSKKETGEPRLREELGVEKSYSQFVFDSCDPQLRQNRAYAALGLTGEAGELANMVKKTAYHGAPNDSAHLEGVLSELGDVLWYLQLACNQHGYTLEGVQKYNRAKLVRQGKAKL